MNENYVHGSWREDNLYNANNCSETPFVIDDIVPVKSTLTIFQINESSVWGSEFCIYVGVTNINRTDYVRGFRISGVRVNEYSLY